MLPELLAEHGDELAAELAACRARLLDELGAVPSYYLRYFYAHDEVLAEQLDGVPRAQTVAEIERELLELYRDPTLDEKPALLEQRGGAFYSEAATGLVASLASGDGAVHVVDVRNDGDARRARGRRRRRGAGARRRRRGPDPRCRNARSRPELLGLVQHVAAYERSRGHRRADAATRRRARRRCSRIR